MKGIYRAGDICIGSAWRFEVKRGIASAMFRAEPDVLTCKPLFRNQKSYRKNSYAQMICAVCVLHESCIPYCCL